MREDNRRTAERKVAVSIPTLDSNQYSRFKITEEGNALPRKRLDLHLTRIKVEMTGPSQRSRHGTYKQWSRELFKIALRAQFNDA